MIDLLQITFAEHRDFITEVCGKLENVGGKNDYMILLQFTQKLLDFQGHHHIEGGQRFIQQDNRGDGL